jgi:NADPH-dependent 2,4-dienoyl-CoA reductase/sulfur reductase-like enzyme
MKNHSDILIIGGGPAGITFARNLKKLKPGASVTMLRPEPYSMVYCAIPYAIEGLFDPQKALKKDELVTSVGVNLVQRAAVKVDLEARCVEDDAGDTHTADLLFLATGASPIRPPIPGAGSNNVFTVKTQQDMEGLMQRIDSGARRAVAVGAGPIGIEQAQAYASRGIETHLVDLAPQLLPAILDSDMTEPLQETLVDHGIHIRLSSKVSDLETRNGAVSRVLISGGDAIELDPEIDFVCFTVGMKPDIQLFEGQGLAVDADGILVDKQMRTNIPGIIAAGDCCSGTSLIDGKPISGKLATNAVPMARTAARVVAGMDAEYAGFVNGSATCAYGVRLGSTGFTQALAGQRGFETIAGSGETTSIFPMMPGTGNLRVKVVADAKDGRIIGGQAVSPLPVTDKIDIFSFAIQSRSTLEDLAKLSYSAQPWQSFFPARSAIVEACENAMASAE